MPGRRVDRAGGLAHDGVEESAGEGAFAAAELAGISEGGLVTPDPAGAVERLGLERWFGGGDGAAVELPGSPAVVRR